MKVDPKLKDWATPTQARYIDAINEHGSARKAADALGVTKNAPTDALAAVRKKAAREGYAPGHWEDGVAPGYVMDKVTIQRRNEDGTFRWERQSPDHEARQEALRAALAAMSEELPRLDPIERPTATLAHLANLYVVTDYHVGMMAWRKEGGADWDLRIAERLLLASFEQMIVSSPRARVGVLAQLGDFLHYDGLAPVTPSSGHVLDADGRYSKVVGVAIRVLRRVIDMMLMRHEEVHVIMAEGNHDMASSVWLRQMFAALYENEPRVSINDSELPFYAYRHGKTMLAFHHGHTKKKEGLPLLFAAQFAEMWGATTKRYAHTGHMHHEDVKEYAGMRVIQHPTLAARDAYASRHGWLSERQASCVTYHDEFGKVGEVVVTPEMLEAA